MIVPNMYGKEPGSYAHGLVRCASSPQMQGLERHLQFLYSQRLEAGDTEREEELQTQIEAVQEQIHLLKKERVQEIGPEDALDGEGPDPSASSESRFIDIRG